MLIPVAELRNGDILKKNVFTKGGDLVCKRGTIVDDDVQRRIKDAVKNVHIEGRSGNTIKRANLLEKGEYITKTVTDKNGIVLVKAGTVVDDSVIRKLADFTGYVEVQDNSAIIDEVREALSDSDKEKLFSVDASVRSAMRSGLKYIYDNPTREEAIDTAYDISSLLADNITESAEMGLDLDSLVTYDEYTFDHSVNVATTAAYVMSSLGRRRKDIIEIGVSGVLHDIGKTQIDIGIINKPGKLTDEEFKIVQRHPLYGYKLVRDKRYLSERAKLGVLQHHEKYSGGGYPLNFSGTEISEFGRRLCVSDVYDALVTKRPYRSNDISPAKALDIMWNSMRGNFDQIFYKEFLSCVIIFPVGSMVTLSNGDVCTVTRNNVGYPLTPCVTSMQDGKKYDLLRDSQCRDIKVVIV